MQLDKLAATGIAIAFAASAPVVALAKNGADDHARVAPASSSDAITLHGSVGPGFTISLTRNGRRVRSLRAGTYRFVIADRGAIHNFVLEKERGGRFERELTDVSAVGAKTVTVRLTPGAWKYYCEPHESMMSGFFTVT